MQAHKIHLMFVVIWKLCFGKLKLYINWLNDKNKHQNLWQGKTYSSASSAENIIWHSDVHLVLQAFVGILNKPYFTQLPGGVLPDSVTANVTDVCAC